MDGEPEGVLDGRAGDVGVLRAAGDLLGVVGGLRVELDPGDGRGLALLVLGELEENRRNRLREEMSVRI